ncbi:MAG: hypothetical protein ABFS14_06740 [Gemmatimonadota bacterium]
MERDHDGERPLPAVCVSPEELTRAGDRPRPLRCTGQLISELIEGTPLVLHGEDREITRFGPLSSLSGRDGPDVLLTYLSSARWAHHLESSTGQVVITSDDLIEQVPEGNALLVTDRSPQEAFYRLFSDSGVHYYERLAPRIDPKARIEPSAVIGDNVWIEADTYVGHNSVVLPNSYLGRGVVIKPNATVGGDGFEPKTIAGRLRAVPHAGGVWLADGVEVGSSTCIDRGLFGEFTYLGPDTKVDNLVHVAHSVTTGERVCLVACSEVSGSATLEDGVWLGPNASVNQLLTLGAHSYVGTGSVVTRNLKRHSLAFGSPAKQSGWVCVCREKLDFGESAEAVCVCGRRFELAHDLVVRV